MKIVKIIFKSEPTIILHVVCTTNMDALKEAEEYALYNCAERPIGYKVDVLFVGEGFCPVDRDGVKYLKLKLKMNAVTRINL